MGSSRLDEEKYNKEQLQQQAIESTGDNTEIMVDTLIEIKKISEGVLDELKMIRQLLESTIPDDEVPF